MSTHTLPPSTPRLHSGLRLGAAILVCSALAACAAQRQPVEVGTAAQLTPATPSTHDLLKLPEPKGKIVRSEEHTSELQSLMRISYAVFCLKKKKKKHNHTENKVQ